MAMTEEHNSMHFLDHLEELRWRLVKSLGSVLLGAVITFFFIDQLIAFLIRPTQDLASPMDLQVLKVQGMFMIKWGIAMIGGIVLSIPVLTYQLWKFIAPGLYLNEKKYAAPLIIFTYISFLIGLIFAYTVIIPFSLDFFTSVGMSGIQNNFSINYYFNFITWLMIGSGFISITGAGIYFIDYRIVNTGIHESLPSPRKCSHFSLERIYYATGSCEFGSYGHSAYAFIRI